jgi:hypothetical protein
MRPLFVFHMASAPAREVIDEVSIPGDALRFVVMDLRCVESTPGHPVRV